MASIKDFKSKLVSTLFWSIISAAFIGPGTVTTASKAGASYGTSLVWALIFSIISTVVLQEAAARITLISGRSIGEIISNQINPKRRNHVKWFLFLSIAIGCAAFQAGNMLGAISGLELFIEISPFWSTLLISIIAAAVLYLGKIKSVAQLLGIIVAIMGIAFITSAAIVLFNNQPDISRGSIQ